ncbi:hypothetical protein [Serratia marcescens]|uniref:hypothetical protein n=1 Tax=Serratia marcescens TaxID=615 RepID=UPI003D053BDE
MKIVRKSMLAMLLAASVPMTGQAAGIVSTVVTASDDIVVSSNAEATVTATGRTDLISGSYPRQFGLGTWSGSVTSGTVAFRFNPAINPLKSGGWDVRYGTAKNTTDSSKSVVIQINEPCTSITVVASGGSWRACEQGTSSVSGEFALDYYSGTQQLTPGSYPVGIDIAAYAY